MTAGIEKCQSKKKIVTISLGVQMVHSRGVRKLLDKHMQLIVHRNMTRLLQHGRVPEVVVEVERQYIF